MEHGKPGMVECATVCPWPGARGVLCAGGILLIGRIRRFTGGDLICDGNLTVPGLFRRDQRAGSFGL